MNLRKDHSHISTSNPVNLSCEGLCRRVLRSPCGGDARGWWGASVSLLGLFLAGACPHYHCLFAWLSERISLSMALSPSSTSQLSAMDVSVRSTMKGAAKCDKHCELQNSVNRQGLERILCFWDIPKSMPASVSMLCCSSNVCTASVHCREHLCLKKFGPIRALVRHWIYKALV